MGLFDKLFGLGKSDPAEVERAAGLSRIRFGRYSDNNKSLAKTNRWYEAEDLFKQKKVEESIVTFFDYLRDEQEDNVRLTKEADGRYTFEIYQGTKIVKGQIDDKEFTASVSLARMEKNSIPVMRRLLEMNYSLYYSRYALHEDRLCMLFDSHRDVCSPNKLYYGLKELATKADKQDDLLVTDFATLKSVDDSHVEKFPEAESEVKYRYFRLWIEQTLKRIDELNQDSFSGGIGYMLLSLIYRIDFMITPEGKLLNEIERINNLYWSNKEEKTAVERNQILKDAFSKLLTWPKEEVLKYFYRAKATFAITAPKPHSVLADSIRASNENMFWYRENKYPDIALQVMEYGFAYGQFSYSLPKPVSDLFRLYMHINYGEFFQELGFKENYYKNEEFAVTDIKNKIQEIIREFKDKYPHLKLDTDRLNFNNLIDFDLSFLTEILALNFDNK
ncbi:MAG: hypothetical protein JNJ58_11860 [Chitinophagaceae bacterium]|nr:hypothetical protein [Chitinophagaceae bacterium]